MRRTIMAGAMLAAMGGAAWGESLYVGPTASPMCQHGDIVQPCASDNPMTRPVQVDAATYNLFTQTQGGTVSLLHGLTKRTCEFAMHRALGEPATDEEIAKQAADRAKAIAEREERDAEWAKWRDTNGCKPDGVVWSSASGATGSKRSDGTCVRSLQVDDGMVTTRFVGPGDIIKAECFQ